jgi:hypothetical protein
MTTGIERRMLDAVWIALAGAGCHSQDHARPAPADGSRVETTTVTLTQATGESEDVRPRYDGSDLSPAEADRLCMAYKARVAVDTSRAAPGRVNVTKDAGLWNPEARRVVCDLVRETKTVSRTVTVQPRCCPPKVTPCNSYEEQRSTTRTVVERAELDGDGRLLKSALVFEEPYPADPPMPYCGRRPDGLALAEEHDGAPAARHLAQMALLEAASVPAFRRLARELEAHGAPAELSARARQAKQDEVRHARVLRRLAARRGARPRGSFTRAREGARALEALAIENAVEGCVREAFGALLATYQATRAATRDVRDAFTVIAADERRHAALAADVDRWACEQLDEAARARVEASRASALAELHASLGGYVEWPALGLPSAAVAHTLFSAYFAAPDRDSAGRCAGVFRVSHGHPPACMLPR